jgi:hypothetical protein
MIRTPHVSLDFKNLSVASKAVFGGNVVTKMTENAAIFVNPDVPLATLSATNQRLSEAAQAATSGDKQKTAALREAEKVWDSTFNTQADYVDRIAGGNENTIFLAGFNPTKSVIQPVTLPSTPVIKDLYNNALQGSIHIELNAMERGVYYLFFVSNSNVAPTFANNQFHVEDNPQVIAFITETHRKVDFYNLPSRATVYVSVVAHNSLGFGIPSSPVAINTL